MKTSQEDRQDTYEGDRAGLRPLKSLWKSEGCWPSLPTSGVLDHLNSTSLLGPDKSSHSFPVLKAIVPIVAWWRANQERFQPTHHALSAFPGSHFMASREEGEMEAKFQILSVMCPPRK